MGLLTEVKVLHRMPWSQLWIQTQFQVYKNEENYQRPSMTPTSNIRSTLDTIASVAWSCIPLQVWLRGVARATKIGSAFIVLFPFLQSRPSPTMGSVDLMSRIDLGKMDAVVVFTRLPLQTTILIRKTTRCIPGQYKKLAHAYLLNYGWEAPSPNAYILSNTILSEDVIGNMMDECELTTGMVIKVESSSTCPKSKIQSRSRNMHLSSMTRKARPGWDGRWRYRIWDFLCYSRWHIIMDHLGQFICGSVYSMRWQRAGSGEGGKNIYILASSYCNQW